VTLIDLERRNGAISAAAELLVMLLHSI